MTIAVSVVVPTFKRTRSLKKCIDALISQTCDRSAYEIIIVDDAPSRDAKSLVEEYAAFTRVPAIRYLAVDGIHGPAAARNCGWKAANGDVIAFTDDDCIPEPDWLQRGTAAFRDGVAGVSGRIFVPVSRHPTDYELNASFLEHSEFATANCFYRRAALEEAGGFDERFRTAWREDADLFFTLLSRNKLLVKASDAIVVHPIRRGHWGISIREQGKSMFNALLYKKHPGLYREKIRNSVLPHYYLIVVSFCLFLLSMSLGLRHFALVPGWLWGASTFSLAVKRLRGTSRAPGHVLEMLVTSLVIPFLSLFWRIAGAIRFNVFFY